MKKIAILASGSGTNAENIYNFFANGNRVRVPLVIYDRKSAGVAQRMEKYPDVNIQYIPGSVWKENPSQIVDLLRQQEIDLVVLAGFLRFVPDELTEAFAGRMLNIHPSLIPAHCGPGMYGDKVHRSVIEAGDKKSGVTVHYVSNVVDGGEILMQEEVDVAENETPESLAQKIHAIEYKLYPRAIVAALNRLSTPPPMLPADEEGLGKPEEATPEEVIATEEVITTEIPEPLSPPAIPGVTPPPSPAEEWARTLGMNFDEEKINSVNTADHGIQNGNDAGSAVPPAAGATGNTFPQPGDENRKMPPTYLVWSVIMTLLCCLPAGVVAIIFACQVSSKFYAGDMEGAEKASERAQIWIIVSFVLGVMANTLYLPLMMLF